MPSPQRAVRNWLRAAHGRQSTWVAVSHLFRWPSHARAAPRAAETARVVAEQCEQSPSLSEEEAAGDYVPHLPARDEVPDAWADAVLSFLAGVSEDGADHGAHLGARAIDLLAGPAVGGREPVDVVITHAFTTGWLVRHALPGPLLSAEDPGERSRTRRGMRVLFRCGSSNVACCRMRLYG